MGISLDSLSITSAFNSILSFFKSQENNSKWKDLTSGSEGTFLIRMLANILSNISYRLVTARRENYLSTANLRSSSLGIALNLGYSAHRGTNQKRMIRFEPNSDYVIPPFTVIGTYNDDYDVIYPSHDTPELTSDYVEKVLEDWISYKEGKLDYEVCDVHGNMVKSYRGKVCGFFIG